MPGSTAAVSPWLRRFHPAPQAPVRLIFFPHAGGSASYFYPHSQALAPDFDVLAVQYPGRQDRLADPLIDTVQALAEHTVQELGPWQDRPLILWGHSMGAAVAFEAARLLEAQGNAPRGVVVSGGRAPAIPRETEVHRKDDDGLIEELAALNGTDPAALGDRELLQMVLPALRSDYKAIETYLAKPEHVVAAPLLVLNGTEDDRVTQEQAQQWDQHTTASATVVTFPGGHFFLTPQQDQVLHTVRKEAATWSP
jgi:pyochelin biosynthesis protein PchC